MSDRRQGSQKALDLMWKVAYHAFHADVATKEAYLSLAAAEQEGVYARCRSACMTYANSRVVDEDFPVDSEEFFQCLAAYIAKIGLPLESSRQAVFPWGATRVAARMSHCIMRSEGYRLEAISEQEFLDRVVGAFHDSEGRGTIFVRKSVQQTLKAWQFTGEPDEDAFRQVFEFRDLQGCQVSAVFVQ